MFSYDFRISLSGLKALGSDPLPLQVNADDRGQKKPMTCQDAPVWKVKPRCTRAWPPSFVLWLVTETSAATFLWRLFGLRAAGRNLKRRNLLSMHDRAGAEMKRRKLRRRPEPQLAVS